MRKEDAGFLFLYEERVKALAVRVLTTCEQEGITLAELKELGRALGAAAEWYEARTVIKSGSPSEGEPKAETVLRVEEQIAEKLAGAKSLYLAPPARLEGGDSMKHVSRNVRRIKVRLFQCTVCGGRQPAVKSLGVTSPGHIKHMYCIKCQAVVPFVQIE